MTQSRPSGGGGPHPRADLEFQQVGGGPPAYPGRADGPVRYRAVTASDRLLGYLWERDEQDAAGFVTRPDAGADGGNAAVHWYRLLGDCRTRGLAPSAALAELAERPPGARTGGVRPGPAAMADDLAALRALAAARPEPQQPPEPPAAAPTAD